MVMSGSFNGSVGVRGGRELGLGLEVTDGDQGQADVAQLVSRPCSAAWSTTGPASRVRPSPVVRVIPSKRADHRGSSRPWRRISYRPDPSGLVAAVFMFRTLGTEVVSADHLMW